MIVRFIILFGTNIFYPHGVNFVKRTGVLSIFVQLLFGFDCEIAILRFDIIKKLGQGTFGKVQLGINKETGQEVAIKTIKKSKIESEADLVRIRREIQIMSSVQHPNIIHIYEGN